jgi:Tfp pilus assembly protein PilO
MAGLTRGQNKIIILSLSLVVFLLCFWLVIYLPQKKKLVSIKEKISYTQAQIAEINKMTEGKDLAEAVRSFHEELISTSKLFSFTEEELISNLTQEGNKLKIRINTIKPLERQLVQDKLDIEELPISIGISAEFKDMATYLKILRDSFPALVKVKKLEVKGSGEGKDRLDMDLEISTYLARGIVK